MAFTMQFKDQFGNELVGSYWRLVSTNISIPDKAASLVFFGYVSKATRDEAKQPVATKQYTIMGEQFEKWYEDVLSAENTNLAKSAYDYAKDCKDFKKSETEVVSFFADATSI